MVAVFVKSVISQLFCTVSNAVRERCHTLLKFFLTLSTQFCAIHYFVFCFPREKRDHLWHVSLLAGGWIHILNPFAVGVFQR